MFNFLDSFCGVEVKEEPTSPAPVSVPEEKAVVPAHEADSKIQEPNAKNAAATKITLKPVDPMDATNYLTTHLTRPMGILFEENFDVRYGGAFLAEINEGGSAAADGSICRGDQLIAIGEKRVSGMDFEEVIKIIEGIEINIKLTVFRGPAESLYGPSGASLSWLDEFVAERGEEAALVEEDDLLDDAAAAAVDAVGETVKADLFNAVAAAVRDAVDEIDNAGKTPVDVDAEAHVEEESTVEVVEELVVAENEIDVEKGTDSEADQEKAADTATVQEELVVVENEVDVVDEEVECEDDLEKETDVAEAEAEEAVVVDNEVVADEEVGCEVDVEKDADLSAVSATSLVEIEVELGEDEFEADLEKIGDAAADVEAEEALEAAENEGNADELEADQEKKGDTADETLVIVENEVEADVEASSEADVEKEVEKSDEVLVVVENEVDVVDEEVECEADLEKESDTADEALVIVENEVEADEEVSRPIALKADAPTLNGAVNSANEDLLDNHYANTASESVATALASVVEKEISNNAGDSFVDPALASVVEKEISNNAEDSFVDLLEVE